MKGNAVKGKAVFEKACAACHRIAGVGGGRAGRVRSADETPEMILTDVLNPNAAIDSNFVSYTVVTKAGRVLTGLLAEETASSGRCGGRTTRRTWCCVARRGDRPTGQSLMPEDGAERDGREMADLIAFLKGWRLLDARKPTRGRVLSSAP
jgi:putative heme-binding domain-containing protein